MHKFVAFGVLVIIGVSALLYLSDDVSKPVQKRGESTRLAELLSDQGIESFARAETARPFVFPEDHGAHPEYRNEWWYLTGNLDGPAAERFGFELTLFRYALAPKVESEQINPSAWHANQVYIGHFAVTDVAGQKFYFAERFSRAGVGLAGATASPFRVWLENWSLASIDDADSLWQLRASAADIELDLSLRPIKPPILNGDRGLSQKSDKPGNATYYYSIPRLQSDGTLRINGTTHSVSGLSWLDREWGSSGLSADQQGWEWFAVQLSDGSDLMFYSLRLRDGNQDPHSAGTWVNPEGQSTALSADDVRLEVLEYWDSPLGGRYPSGWRVEVQVLDLELQLEPVLDAQELNTTPRYWEGAVDVSGQRAGVPIDGRGYVELTGYAKHADEKI